MCACVKEVVLSSQIEGIQFALSDPLLFETEVRAGEPMDEMREVSNDVDAVIHSLDRPKTLPLSLRLLRSGRGQGQRR